MNAREAMKMALDAIDVYGLDYMHGLPKKKYVDALRAALAQPDTEMPKTLCGPNLEEVLNTAGFFKRKPLTEEQIAQIDWKDGETLHDFARAIERAHGIGGEHE